MHYFILCLFVVSISIFTLKLLPSVFYSSFPSSPLCIIFLLSTFSPLLVCSSPSHISLYILLPLPSIAFPPFIYLLLALLFHLLSSPTISNLETIVISHNYTPQHSCILPSLILPLSLLYLPLPFFLSICPLIPQPLLSFIPSFIPSSFFPHQVILPTAKVIQPASIRTISLLNHLLILFPP